jgi:hypothetical protein
MSLRSKAAIARSNKRKGSAGNLMFKKYLQGLFQGSRVWNSHRRSGDEFGADLVLDSGKSFAFQVKRCKSIPASMKKALSDDGYGLILDDSGLAIAIIQIDPKEVFPMEETKIVDHDELIEHLSQGYRVKSYLGERQYLIAKVSYCCEGEDVVLHQN